MQSHKDLILYFFVLILFQSDSKFMFSPYPFLISVIWTQKSFLLKTNHYKIAGWKVTHLSALIVSLAQSIKICLTF